MLKETKCVYVTKTKDLKTKKKLLNMFEIKRLYEYVGVMGILGKGFKF